MENVLHMNIPNSDDTELLSLCKDFMQEKRSFETIESTKFPRGTVSIIVVMTRCHESSELQINNNYSTMERLSAGRTGKIIRFIPVVNQRFQKHRKESINIKFLRQLQKNTSKIPLTLRIKE